MARYDRIARLTPPAREDAFPCWMTLRDLQARERDPSLGRRARLRFLALRPVHRLLRRGDHVTARSLGQQLDSVRDELGVLPVTDPERRRLAAYLEEVGGRTPSGMAAATLDVGAAAEAAGHTYAAEEFYRVGLEVTERHGLTAQRIRALRRLGRVHRTREEWDAAIQLYDRAATLARAAGDLLEWARARRGVASVRSRMGAADEAREVLDAVAARGLEAGEDAVRAEAAAGRCALEREAGRLEAAVEAGWAALQLLRQDDEQRNAVLLDMASCFRWLGLPSAAEASYQIVALRGAWPEHRLEARIEHAVVAAESGRPELFRSRRAELVERPPADDPRLACMLDLGLGQGCMMTGDEADAREHLRRAIATARDASLDAMLGRAEELLEDLERRALARRTPQRRAAPHGTARRIARDLESLSAGLAAAD